jgi:hypothetical protein
VCDGTLCPCNLEEKPKKVVSPDQQRKGAIVALNLFGPILAACIVTAATGDTTSGVLLMFSWWLIALVWAVVATVRRPG